MLAALGTTLEQMSASMTANSNTSTSASVLGSSSSLSVVPTLGRSLNGSSSTLSLSDRVDLAVRRLGELRSWSREEAKGRRNLEERSESQEQELLSVQNALEDTQKTLRKTTIQSSEKETEMREKQREITGLQIEIIAKQEEIERMRRDDSSLGGSLEAERRGRQKQLAELQGKDRELMLLKSDLEAQLASHSKLQDQMSSVKERLNETVVELEEKEEQLRVTKAHNLRLNVTLEQLERGSEADNKDRQILENRVGVAEGLNTTIIKLKAQLSDAESSERFSKEQMKLLSDSKIELEARYAQTLRDNESSRKVHFYIYI